MAFDEYLTEEMEEQRMNGGSSDVEDDDQSNRIDEEFILYSRFIEWLDSKTITALMPKINHESAYIQTERGRFWLNDKGKIESDPKATSEPWQMLWDIWQKEIV